MKGPDAIFGLIKFYSLIDFYHAVEYLVKIADLRKGWKKSERNAWVKKHSRQLLHGKIKEVIASICKVCRGKKKVKSCEVKKIIL